MEYEIGDEGEFEIDGGTASGEITDIEDVGDELILWVTFSDPIGKQTIFIRK